MRPVAVRPARSMARVGAGLQVERLSVARFQHQRTGVHTHNHGAASSRHVLHSDAGRVAAIGPRVVPGTNRKLRERCARAATPVGVSFKKSRPSEGRLTL